MVELRRFGVVLIAAVIAGGAVGAYAVVRLQGGSGTAGHPVSFLGPPTLCHIEETCINATVVNSSGEPIDGVIFAVFRNASTGANVSTLSGSPLVASSCRMDSQKPSACYLLPHLVSVGAYSVTIFVTAGNETTRLSPSISINLDYQG